MEVGKKIMRRFTTMFATMLALTGVFAWASYAGAAAPLALEAAWWGPESHVKSPNWPEQLLGEVVTYQTLAEKGVIAGDFKPYLDKLIEAREAYRTGKHEKTYESINQFMAMLEARVGGIDDRTADAIWNYCYQVTPDRYHARDRHARAIGQDELKKQEEFLRNMEERAAHSF
ncbi:MAG TPA: hypothetical protein VNK46_16580 [Nitrospiraceae bacterium]|jgi:hypothetical protein|nr:hypothetical protein [Nitrospiraceae bacterium]